MSDHEFGFETRALHAGSRPEPTTGARALPEMNRLAQLLYENFKRLL